MQKKLVASELIFSEKPSGFNFKLKKENLIAFKYCDENGNVNESSNPNGALENIAGIYNTKKNILGMMPHPERMVDDIISNTDGINLFSGLIN